MKSRLLLAIATVACASAGCGNPTGYATDTLAVDVLPGILNLANRTSSPTYYFVVERRSAALIDWTTCNDPDTCTSKVAGDAAKAVPFADIAGYDDGEEEAIVYHWKLVAAPGGAGFRPDSIRALVVNLK